MKKIVYLACVATCGLCVESSFGTGWNTLLRQHRSQAPAAAPVAPVVQPAPIPQQDPQSTSAIAQEKNEIAALKAENETLRAEIAELERQLAEKHNTNVPIWSNSNTPEE